MSYAQVSHWCFLNMFMTSLVFVSLQEAIESIAAGFCVGLFLACCVMSVLWEERFFLCIYIECQFPCDSLLRNRHKLVKMTILCETKTLSACLCQKTIRSLFQQCCLTFLFCRLCFHSCRLMPMRNDNVLSV